MSDSTNAALIAELMDVDPPAPPRYKRIWAVAKLILRGFPKWMGLYLALCGLIFFNLFIFEEAQQQVIFSTWSSKAAGEWPLLKGTIPLLEDIHATSSTINKYFGWINPIGYMAYSAYNKAEEEQIKSIRALVFANAPELFDGETVTFSFQPHETEYLDGYAAYRAGRITVLSADLQPVVTGAVTVTDGVVVVDARPTERMAAHE